LHTTKAELNSTQTQLDSTKTELKAAEVELASTKTELESTVGELANTETELQSTKEELQSAEKKEGLMTGHGYSIKDPTYNEMMSFVDDDDTDKAEYIKGEYECTEFSTDLCNRAEEKGIRCAYVSIRFPSGGGHAIVAFNTIDKGLIYIEPQYDDMVKIEIGKPFYKCVVPSGDYKYEKPAQDDTIEKVLVAW